MCLQDIAISRSAEARPVRNPGSGSYVLIKANPRRIALRVRSDSNESTMTVKIGTDGGDGTIVATNARNWSGNAPAFDGSGQTTGQTAGVIYDNFVHMDYHTHPGIITMELVVECVSIGDNAIVEVLSGMSIDHAIRELET